MFGFKSTSAGVPLDTFGRNLYLDTLNSAYGTGWKRENSFLTHKGNGVVLLQRQPAPPPRRDGAEYRATIQGPGVTPDVMWQGQAPGAYDKATDDQRNLAIGLQLWRSAVQGEPRCRELGRPRGVNAGPSSDPSSGGGPPVSRSSSLSRTVVKRG